MDAEPAMLAFAALAQPTRLAAFRLLVGHEPQGLPAGEIAERLAVPANTMSAHLAALARSGLVTSRRTSRTIVYRADLDRLRAVIVFLLKDCCEGRAELCEPLLAELTTCCN